MSQDLDTHGDKDLDTNDPSQDLNTTGEQIIDQILQLQS